MIASFKLISINLFVLLVGILIIEIQFGDWFLDNRLFMTRIPRSQVRVVDVSPLYYRNPSEIPYTRDKYGLRAEEFNLNEIDILTIGESTTEQRYIDDQKTWQAVLASDLSTRLNRKLIVVNVGVDGQTSFGHLLNFNYWFNLLPP